MEDIRLPRAPMTLSGIRLPDPPHSGHETISLHDASFTYDHQRWIFRNLSLQILRGEKVALVGYNGMGKTTLLRVLAGVKTCTEGKLRLGHQVIIGYQSQEFAETMPPDQSLFQLLKDTNPAASDAEIRSLLGSFGFSGDAILKTVSALSGGEKFRLAFARIFIKPPNFLLLDEPTTHLDIASREALEKALSTYSGTVCFVSHDIEFVRHTAQRIIAITPSGVQSYAGGYDYYREKAGNHEDPTAQPNSQQLNEKKLSRKERAERHERNRQRLMTLRKAVRTHEEKIESLEREQQQLIEALSADTQLDFAQTNQRLSDIQHELTHHTNQWEANALELEEIEQAMQDQ
jgi:ATP-binding cassette subfamily F protein 3